MAYFAGVNEAGFVEAQMEFFSVPADDGVGPPSPFPVGEYTYYEIPEMNRDARPTKTSLLMWVDGGMVWVEQATLGELQAAAIDSIDAAADAARAKVLVKQTNNIEYQAALADASKYRDAGFMGAAGPGVTTWTHAKRRHGWTDRDAAENILATAAVWEGALMFIRGLRLDAKEMVRDAATNAEVDTLLATFTATLAAAMQGVQ